ncbi:fibronectin type III domain-containing protein, partial [Polaromonas sp.]|uniref:fibronectin type III domain-containing protein n=1 Tax=Polaromonas sp. TaxID=1869339 RepID=UPI0037CBA56E
VSGLTNGITYTFWVSATNAAGNSGVSNAVQVTPNVIPNAPTNLTVTAGNTNANLSWTAPTSNGGTDISSYNVISSPTGGTAIINFIAKTAIVSGLTNGITYTFWVSATNAAGNSGVSNAVQVTPNVIPNAPTNVTATVNNAQVTVNWTEPTSNGGTPIISYKIERSTNLSSWDFDSSANNLENFKIINGLTNGTIYYFRVFAINAKGTSIESVVSNQVIQNIKPNSPTIGTATAGNTNATVTWIEPISNGGTPITSYTVTSSPGGLTETTTNGTTLTATVSGLTNGIAYTFTVTATNAAGTSTASDATTPDVIPYTIPSAPTITTTASNGLVDLSWNAPANNGRDISSYIIDKSIDSSSWEYYSSTNATTFSKQITGLTNGTTYYFRVYATNLAGNGLSNVVNEIPFTIPNQIESIDLVFSNDRVDLSWNAPFNGGRDIIDYFIRGYIVSSNTLFASTNRVSTNITTSDFGELNGQELRINIAARNIAGYSTSTDVYFIPYTVPAQITSIIAVPGNSIVDLSWNAPYNRGRDISSYKIEKSTDLSSWFIDSYANGSTSFKTITNLSNSTLYYFRVYATNVAGDSLSSIVVNEIPYTVPSAPILNIIADNSLVDLSWNAPINNGRDISSYIIDKSIDSSSWEYYSSTNATTLSKQVTDLSNNVKYYFRVYATNLAGNGLLSNVVNEIPYTVPSAPTLNIIAGNGLVDLSWNAPANNGRDISSYIIDKSIDSSNWEYYSSTNATTLNKQVIGLTNNVKYYFRVYATNLAGDGLSSNVVNEIPYTVPSAPILNIIADNSLVDLSWNAPINNGRDISSYIIDKSIDSSSWEYYSSTNATTLSKQVTDLSNNVKYYFRVYATNLAGNGLLSNVVNEIPYTVPSAPTLYITADNSLVDLSWNVPANNGRDISSYIIDKSIDSSNWEYYSSTNATTFNKQVTDLSNNVKYYFRVYATNLAGDGLLSNVVNEIPYTVPSAPTLNIIADNSLVDLSWNAPANNGRDISSYIIDKSIDSSSWEYYSSTNATTLSKQVTDLSNNVKYYFRVYATNLAGNGLLSNVVNEIPYTVPSAPTLYITADNSLVDLSWNVPANNGRDISSYIIDKSIDSSNWEYYSSTNATTFNKQVTDLSNNVKYYFRVYATNLAGDGLLSNVVNEIPYTVPSAPTLNITAGNSLVDLSWNAPANNGRDISIYKIDKSIDSSSWEYYSSTNASTSFKTVTDLSNGILYYFRVYATNLAGDSSSSNIVNAIPFTIPLAPTIGAAIGCNNHATVTWNAPSNNGGSIITSYTVTSSPGGITATVDGTTLIADVLGLINQAYTFTVVATNAAGDSLPSRPSNSVIPITTSSAPTIGTVTAGNAQATVTWTAPTSNGGSIITGYNIISNYGNMINVNGSLRTATVPGLTNGSSYTFTVVAINAVGISSPSSPSNSVIPITIPDAPIIGTATASNAEATITWTAPVNNGGTIITGYTVTSNSGNLITVDGSKRIATVTGLTNGSTYTFTVVATNAVGDSLPSGLSNSVIPNIKPNAPTIETVTAGNTQVTITWIAPVSNGGTIITGYTITSNSGNVINVDGSLRTAIVTGLTNGSSYTFTVVAINAVGISSPSSPSNSVIPNIKPNAPTIERVTAGNTEVTITWTAPTCNGGTIITGYTITSSSGNIITVDGSIRTATVTGLTNGTSYTFTVVATNATGDSLPSSPSNSVIPNIKPNAPTIETVTAGNAQATVTWATPISNGGTTITGYTIISSFGNIINVDSSIRTATITGLINGTAYTFTVVATNAAGDSLPSSPSNLVTTNIKPNAPTIETVTAGNSQATVTWTAPANNGGTIITGYTITSSSGNVTTVDGSLRTATINELTNGTSYTFTVVAINAIGISLPSSPSNSVIPNIKPNAPTIETVTAGNVEATVTWAAPVSNGGTTIIGYTVTSNSGNLITVDGSLRIATVTGLTNGTSYTFTVVATNAAGDSLASSPSNSVIPNIKPNAPTIETVTVGNVQATVTWTAPTNNGGTIITGYTVTSSSGNVTNVNGSLRTATVIGLTNGSSYTFTVVATNAVGDSLPSNPSNLVIPITIPDAPMIGTAIGGNTEATVTWTTPENNGSSVITGYIITSSPGNKTATIIGSITTGTVYGLTNGISYTFTVVATNAAGISLPSNSSNSVIPISIPNAPIIGPTIACNNHAIVTWDAPTSDGGSVITSYTVTSTPGGVTVTVDGTTLITDISGLINQVYTFTVIATNAIGDSLPSSPSNSVTPIIKPDAPIIGIATAGNAQATVTWDTPANNGGSIITSYTVRSSPGNKTTTVDGSIRTANITGLTNGTAYTFTVVATNEVNNSIPSSSSNSVIPKTIPSAPIIGTAIPSNMQATVNWNAPTSNGGSSITGYIITSNPGGKTATVGSAIRSVNITELTNGIAYTFTVVAINDVGISLPSNSSNSIIPRTIPNAPTIGIATAGNTRASVTWTAPTNNGGSSITGYTVISNPGGKTATVNGSIRTAIVIGLTNGIPYTFTVVATNIAGNSLQSESSNSVIPKTIPGAPIIGNAIPYNTRASVTWTAPTNNGGSIITGYTVISNPEGKTITVDSSIRTAIVTGLTNGIAYTFKVFAINAMGTSQPSISSNSIIPILTISNAPIIGSATAYNLSSFVTWTPSTDNGGSVITSYTVRSSPGGISATVDSSITSTIVNGLTNGTLYTFKVFATNAIGNSPLSNSSNLVIPRTTIPSAPIIESAIAYNTQATVTWTTPINNGGFVITSYTVTSNPGNIRTIVSGLTTTAIVDGLTNGTPYTFNVFATNAL